MPVKIGAKAGFIDRSFKPVFETTFEDVKRFSQGMAAVKVNSKWGFINRKGEWLIPPQFDDTKYFADGLAPVTINNLVIYEK